MSNYTQSRWEEAENFVYFNPNTCSILEHQHYDIGIDMQSTCSMPPVGTMGIMLPQKEYLLESLNVRQKYVFDPIVHLIKYKLEPIYVFLSGNAGGVGKSVVLRALYLY